MAITRTLAEITCAANQQTQSGIVLVPGSLSEVTVSLTSSQWFNAALAGKRVLWGLALSMDGGLTWGPVTCGTAANLIGGASILVPSWVYQTDVIGRTGLGGAIGEFVFDPSNMLKAIGGQVRLFAWPEVAIPLGVQITAV